MTRRRILPQLPPFVRPGHEIQAELALEARRRMSLRVGGIIHLICDHYYGCATPLPDNRKIAPGRLGCTVRQWKKAKAALLALGEIKIVDRHVIPTGNWHRSSEGGDA